MSDTHFRVGRARMLMACAALLLSGAGSLYAFLGWKQKEAEGPKPTEAPVAAAPVTETLNKWIMQAVESYPTDGSYKAVPPAEQMSSHGVSKDITYLGSLISKGDPEKRTYCVGLVYEVFIDAWKMRFAGNPMAKIGSLDVEGMKAFRRKFYGADGNPRTFVDTLVQAGLGEEILDKNSAQPGDLIQFWRSKSGHSVVFIDWVRDPQSKRITGIEYWGSSWKSGGISYRKEEIGRKAGMVDPDRIYIVRCTVPK